MRARRFALLLFAVALVAGAGGLACQALIGLEDPQGEPVIKPEAGVDAAPEAAPPRRDDCAHARLVDIPETDDDPSGKIPPFWAAVRQFELAPTDGGLGDGAVPGFDIDNVCTCFGADDAGAQTDYDAAPSCVSKYASGGVVCDQRNGIDNAIFRILQPYASIYDIDRLAGVNQRFADGRQGILFWVADYNGKANDRSVTVGAVISPGLYSLGACGGTRDVDAGVDPIDGGELPHPASWDGCDEWAVRASQVTFAGNNTVPTRVSQGYVRDYTLVIKGGGLSAPLAVGPNLVDIRAPFIQAKLVPMKGSFGIAGTAAGRVPLVSVLRSASNLQLSGTIVCKSPFLFEQLKGAFCENLDVSLQDPLDFAGVECDGASVASLFVAEPAKIDNQPPRPDVTVPNACDAIIPPTATVADICAKDGGK